MNSMTAMASVKNLSSNSMAALMPAPHQIEARDAAVELLVSEAKAKVIMACGTGKTLVGGLVAQALGAKLVVVFAPSIALVKQSMDAWIAQQPIGSAGILCVCSDETVGLQDGLGISVEELGQPATTNPIVIRAFLANSIRNKIVFSTYQSAEMLGAALADGQELDFGIFDEAHRTAGSEGKGFGFALSDANIKIKRRLFLTATPKQFDSERKTKDGDLIEVRSMDDEAIYGKEAYRLSFLEAVRRNLIVDFKVVVSVVIGEDIKNDLLSNGLVDLAGSPVALRNAANLIALRKCAKNLGLSKAFTFHESIKRAEHFSKIASMVAPTQGDEALMEPFHINGGFSSKQRVEILKSFAQSQQALLSNVRCLTEGIDVPEVEIVAFMSPKNSTQEIVQACGRAMRKAPQKTCGYVFLPILIDLGHGESVETALQRSKLGPLWDVLEAMTECDESIFEALVKMRRARGSSRTVNAEDFARRIIVQGPDRLLGDIRRAVTAMAVTNLTSTWDEMYGLLQAYFDKHGHVDIPANYKVSDIDLGGWVCRQRTRLRAGVLQEQRKQLLDEMGFRWELIEDSFEELFSELQTFQAIHGHCDVRKPHGQRLFSWVLNLRKNRRMGVAKGYLGNPDRIIRLDSIGFDWNGGKDARFEERFSRFVAYRECHGESQIDRSLDQDLYTWVEDLRRQKKRANLKPERIARLESVGFVWSFKDEQWDVMFQRCANYMASHEVEAVSVHSAEDRRSLSLWMHDQRKFANKGTLREDRRVRLSSIGFEWEPLEAKWGSNYRALSAYAKRFGDCLIPIVWPSNPELGKWVGTQRGQKKLGLLSKEREDKLNAIGFVWESPYKNEQDKWREIFLERGFELTGFMRQHKPKFGGKSRIAK